MSPEQLEKTLLAFVDDNVLADNEKSELRRLLSGLSHDRKGFLRNRAFAIARERILAGAADPAQVLAWLQRVIGVMDGGQAGARVASSAHFSPGNDCRNKLLDLLVRARETVDICVFTISDNALSETILDVHRRNVAVRIVTDNDKAHDMGSDIHMLIERGINLCIDDSPYHMHHKFMVIDSSILVNGSFNWTSSASMNNEENILVTTDPILVAAYQEKFHELWEKFSGR